MKQRQGGILVVPPFIEKPKEGLHQGVGFVQFSLRVLVAGAKVGCVLRAPKMKRPCG